MTKLITNHLPLVASATKGVMKLRTLILTLAVMGKLVPQNPKNEPASAWLRRIQSQRNSRKELDAPREREQEPFSLPQGWEWVTFSQIGDLSRGKSKHRPRNEPSLFQDGTYPLVQTGDIARATDLVTTYSSLYNEKGLAQSRLWPKGTLCITIAANIADTAILGLDACFPDSVVGFLPFDFDMDVRFFSMFMKTAKKYLEDAAPSTAQKNINVGILQSLLLPLPPLLELKRIVEKVDELMALCDRLEAQQSDAEAAHIVLVKTLLGTLTQSKDQPEFATSWERIKQNFDTLFTTEASVDALKQTLVQLAVMGKLVPHDPADEPAEELIKRIQRKKAELVTCGELKQEKPLGLISEQEKPYELPPDWTWSRIGDYSLFTEYGISEKTFDMEDGVPVVKMGDIQNGKVLLGRQKKVSRDIEVPLLKKYDLLYNRTNSAELVGKTGVFEGPDGQYAFASYLIRIRCIRELSDPKFLNLAMNAPAFRETQINPYLKQQCGQANVNGTALKNMLIPVPPLPEQQRIVVKIEHLLSICDILKERICESGALREVVSMALVDQAVSSSGTEIRPERVPTLT